MPSILEIKKTLGSLSRLRDILIVFFEEGFGFLIEKIKLTYLLPFRLRLARFFKKDSYFIPRRKFTDSAVRLRLAFERLGPSFIKLGQILSLRPDIIPESYCQELQKLQDQAPTFSFTEVKRIIQGEFRKPLEEVFLSFDEKPFAAASLAQVHKAILKNGEKVAVKVQRPNIKKIIEEDIHILLFLASLFERYIPESRNYRPVKLIKEFAAWTLRELDFRIEATNADHFRAILQDYPNVKIPQVYWDYTTKKVLTMELVKGIKIDEPEVLKKKKIDPKEIASLGLTIAFRQLFVEGFFQADPHPGNFSVLPGNILCLHDFGMVGYLSPETRSELTAIFMGLLDKNTEAVLKHLIHLAEINEDSELKLFYNSVFDILSRFFYGLGRQESAAVIFYRVVNTGAKYGVLFPSDLIYFGKALMTAEVLGLKLWPDFNFDETFKPFLTTVILNQLSPQKVYSELRSDLFDFARFLKNLPENTLKLLNKLESGDIGVKINPKEFLEIKKEIDRQNDIKVLTLITIASILATAILLRVEKAPIFLSYSFGYLGILISLFLIIWSIIKVRK